MVSSLLIAGSMDEGIPHRELRRTNNAL